MGTARNNFLRSSALLMGAMVVVNLLNYGYALILGRWLGPAEYGGYAAFTSLFLVLTVLPLTLQQLGARYTAAGGALAYTRAHALKVGTGLGLGLLALSIPLERLTSLPAAWYAALAVFLPVYALLGAARGEVQGKEQQGRLGLNMVAEHLSKIVLTFPALALFGGSSAAVAATLAGVAVALWLLRGELRPSGPSVTPESGYPASVGVNLLAQALILNADLLLAKALLEPHEAGLYAAVAMIGRIVFYGSWAVGTAVFPMVARAQSEGRSHWPLLGMALLSVATVSVGFVGVCALAPRWVVGVLFGGDYLEAAALVAPYAAMTALYALANVIANHFMALGKGQLGWWALGTGVLQAALMMGWHSSGMELILVQMIAKGCFLAVGGWAILTHLRERRVYVLR
ncbi:MAG: oligosaccharide flippase family protein [Meiothermus sp.]|nr:oligosaccharide flippase family protein [Meiothermus sp.]